MMSFSTLPDDPTLFWHRRDLRLADNPGLSQRDGHAPVVPVYCIDPSLLESAGEFRLGFFERALEGLQAAYRKRGSDLLVRYGPPEEEIPSLADTVSASRVAWNRDYSRYAKERDTDVESALTDLNVESTSSPGLALHEPGSITTSAGEHYSVFSYYHKKWRDRAVPDAADPIPGSQLAEIDTSPVAESFPDVDRRNPPIEGSREAALKRLERFVDGPIYRYEKRRDRPVESGTSRLSQDLSFGLLGIREVIGASERAATATDDDAERESVEEYQRQLAWRDFYIQMLDANPEMDREPLVDFENPIEWREDPEGLRAWKRGETGYPIVDAGMRQLREEGYMHNRLRMITASFLSKDLLISWRRGYEWFRRNLIDHDTASEAGGWHWAASTGTDAQPYFRVFNPTLQGERYDPDAVYIKRFVPELEAVDSAVIHQWPDLSPEQRESHAPGYPDPIVDHDERREMAIETFERARNS
ncbi:MAG: deoxyribodipyrimidine photo-lyase [Halodesulfurarchaeum sp.]